MIESLLDVKPSASVAALVEEWHSLVAERRRIREEGIRARGRGGNARVDPVEAAQRTLDDIACCSRMSTIKSVLLTDRYDDVVRELEGHHPRHAGDFGDYRLTRAILRVNAGLPLNDEEVAQIHHWRGFNPAAQESADRVLARARFEREEETCEG